MERVFKIFTVFTLIISFIIPASLRAETIEEKLKRAEEELQRIQEELRELKEKQREQEEKTKETEVLKEEIRKLRLEMAIPEVEIKSYYGLGPAASKVYYTPRALSIGGYGEALYENFLDSSKNDRGDIARFVAYMGYKYSENIIMNTEIEFEHAGIGEIGDKEPEITVEFMYIDFIINPFINIRPGLFLVPSSLMNEYHEPVVYYGVLRPDVERFIIPTVWRELGIMFYGNITKNITYKGAIMNGIRTDKIKDWIRDGRQKGAQVNFDKFAGILRLDYSGIKGLTVGGSVYIGEGEDKKGGDADNDQEARFNLNVIEAQYEYGNMHLKGLYSFGRVWGNEKYRIAGRAKKVYGWYAEAAYNIFPHIKPESTMSLSPYYRYERYNLNDDVFVGLPDKTKAREVFTMGLEFKPHSQIVIKADYQLRDTDSNLPEGKGTGKDEWKIDQFNIGIGFIF